jgi:hypothetical protein
VTATADRIADDVIERSLEFESVRDMIAAAAVAGASHENAAADDNGQVLTLVAMQLVREHLGLQLDALFADVKEELVRRALDADRWQAPSRAYRAAIGVVFEALGVRVDA